MGKGGIGIEEVWENSYFCENLDDFLGKWDGFW